MNRVVFSHAPDRWSTPVETFAALDEIRFIKGRLKFGGSKNSAPFPFMVVIFVRTPHA